MCVYGSLFLQNVKEVKCFSSAGGEYLSSVVKTKGAKQIFRGISFCVSGQKSSEKEGVWRGEGNGKLIAILRRLLSPTQKFFPFLWGKQQVCNGGQRGKMPAATKHLFIVVEIFGQVWRRKRSRKSYLWKNS